MKPVAQRIAIAEACGWIPCGKCCDNPTHWEFVRDNGNSVSTRNFAALPDYLNDLNAMHEAEKYIPDKSKWDYEETLLRIIERNPDVVKKRLRCFGACTATAAQRAEAFLKTIGKWRDE